LTYVPNDSKTTNKDFCKKLSEELQLEMFEYITVIPNYGSMTKANTKNVRERVIQKYKFCTNNLPARHYNVLIYDDAVKSGMTLDKVAQTLKEQNPDRMIISVVDTIWNGGDLPDPVIFKID